MMRSFFRTMTHEQKEQHIRLLFESFRKATGRTLWSDEWTSLDDAGLLDAVENAPCVIASHGTESDPVLNYGNRTALSLWQATVEEFTTMPSRLTAEPMERSERERLLYEVTTHGFIDNYTGVRISTSGKRFQIHKATVWNVIDEGEVYRGQAVVFSEWDFLPEENS